MPEPDLRARREAVVREHMEAENHHDFDTALGTFDHPRYELIATGEVYDGAEAVSRYYQATRTAFPDQRNEVIALHHSDDAIIAEFVLRGTHQGELQGFPATGKEFSVQMVAVFMFEDDRITIERIYFDALTILRQLGLAPGAGAPTGTDPTT